MTGYVQWPSSREFKAGDVALNGGLVWQLDDASKWRIIDDGDYLPVCGVCGQPKRPNVLKAHQRECEGEAR